MRLVILVNDLLDANVILRKVLEAYSNDTVGIICSNTLIPGASHGQAVRQLIRKMGVGYPLSKGVELTVACLARGYLRCTFRTPWLRPVRQMAKEYGIPTATVRRINGERALATLRAWEPDLAISVYVHQVIREPLMQIPSRGVINVHPSLLPRNRGMIPYIWALSKGETTTGVTVHWVDEQLDTGDIIVQREMDIGDRDTVSSLTFRSAHIGGELLVDAITKIRSGTDCRCRQNESDASYFSWPDRPCLRRLRNRGRRLGSVREMWREFARAK